MADDTKRAVEAILDLAEASAKLRLTARGAPATDWHRARCVVSVVEATWLGIDFIAPSADPDEYECVIDAPARDLHELDTRFAQQFGFASLGEGMLGVLAWDVLFWSAHAMHILGFAEGRLDGLPLDTPPVLAQAVAEGWLPAMTLRLQAAKGSRLNLFTAQAIVAARRGLDAVPDEREAILSYRQFVARMRTMADEGILPAGR